MMEIYATDLARSVRVLSRLKLANRPDGVVVNQIAYEGEWLGHGAGAFEFTAEVFDAIIANFGRRKDSIPLTYGHPDGETASFMGAAGWIHSLTTGTDDEGRLGLFAAMEFSERSAAQVKAGEQRYCSVVVTFDGIDEKSGEPIGPELFEVGLVLSAFVDGMRPLAASRNGRKIPPAHGGTNPPHEGLAMSTNKDIVTEALAELGDDFEMDSLIAYVEAEKAKRDAVEGTVAAEEPEAEGVAASGENTGAETVAAAMDEAVEPEEEAAAASSAVGAIVAAVVAEGGTADEMTIDAFLQENASDVAALFMAAPEEGTESDPEDIAAMSKESLAEKALSAQLEAAHESIAALTKRLDDAEVDGITAQVDAAIAASAVTEEMRGEWIELGRKSPKVFAAQLKTATSNTAPAGVPKTRLHKPKAPVDSTGTLSADLAPQDDEERDLVAKLQKRRLSKDAVVVRLGLFRDEREKMARNAAR